MNAMFQVQEISKHHNGDVEVTLRQVYDSQNRQLSDSTNPGGEISVTITDQTGFFQQGQKYLVNFRSTVVRSASVTLANGQDIDPVERSAWFKSHPDATHADFVAYKNAQNPQAPGDGYQFERNRRTDGPTDPGVSPNLADKFSTAGQTAYPGQAYPDQGISPVNTAGQNPESANPESNWAKKKKWVDPSK